MIPSIASEGPSIGPRAARHLDLLWRDMMKAQGSSESDRHFRLITGEPHPLGNLAILREASDAAFVQETVAPLMGLSQPAAVLFVAGVGDAIADQLTAQGLARMAPMPAMAVDIATLRPTQLPEGCDFVRVLTPDDVIAWTDVVTAGFGLPRGLARLLSPELHGASPQADAAVQYFGIRSRGKMVATSMFYLADGLAGIYSVATLEEARGRGLGAHVTAEALRVAHRLGCGVGVLQSSAAGHNVYRELGFRDVGSVEMFVRVPASSSPSEL